jgi:hypothetical protein
MYGEAKKLHLIEAILRIENDILLAEVQTLLEKNRPAGTTKKSFKKFAGIFSIREIKELEKAISDLNYYPTFQRNPVFPNNPLALAEYHTLKIWQVLKLLGLLMYLF